MQQGAKFSITDLLMNDLNYECSTCLYSAYFHFSEGGQPGAVSQWNDFIN